MQYIGHPLFGDKTYGGAQIVKGLPSGKYNQFVQNSFEILPATGACTPSPWGSPIQEPVSSCNSKATCPRT